MSSLSSNAARILNHMEPDRAYDAAEIRALLPENSLESVRETMHELWLDRQVERAGYGHWRRSQSTCTAGEVHASVECQSPAAADVKETKGIKPEDLFDHDTFSGFFKDATQP